MSTNTLPGTAAVPSKSSKPKKLGVLESIRGLAALYVFLGHFLMAHVLSKHSRLGFFLRFGQEAVMVFFVLSGFVIYYSIQKHHDASFRTYFSRRFNRIYPIFVLCLALSYLAASLSYHHFLPVRPGQLFGNLFMLQDNDGLKPGVWVAPYYSNLALWSLSYEWWFYMMFYPVNRYVRPDNQKRLVAGLSLAGFFTYVLFPNQISLFLLYFFIWWTGVEIAKSYTSGRRPTIQTERFSLLILSALTALLLCNAVFYRKVLHKSLEFGVHPVLELRHFLFALFLVSLALSLSPRVWSWLRQLLKPVTVLAPISYGLYILHIPLAVHGTYLSFLGSRPVEVLGYAAIAFLVAYLAEFPFQRWVNSKWRRSADTVSTAHAP